MGVHRQENGGIGREVKVGQVPVLLSNKTENPFLKIPINLGIRLRLGTFVGTVNGAIIEESVEIKAKPV